MTSKKLTE
jgi:translation initiation factor 3 subunit B